MSRHIPITPAEMYHFYRFDEPTRDTQDAIRMAPFMPHIASMPTAEQIFIACATPSSEPNRQPTITPPLNRAERRRQQRQR